MYDKILYPERKHFCRYCLKAFSTEEILKSHIKDCFKINGTQRIIMPKKDEYVKFRKYERRIRSPFTIYTNFESILMPEHNGKQNPEESYTNKYQEQIACSYGYKLVCVDDEFSQSFKIYLGEDVLYNFINSMTKESKYCIEVIKKHFSKELVMTKEDNDDFNNSTNVGFVTMIMLIMMLKARVIPAKYRCSADRDSNIFVKLSHKTHIVFHNLKKYDSHLIM